LPGIDHRLVHAVFGAELRQRQLALDRLECYFCFEFSAVTLAVGLGHQFSSFLEDEPSLISCPIRGDPLYRSCSIRPLLQALRSQIGTQRECGRALSLTVSLEGPADQ